MLPVIISPPTPIVSRDRGSRWWGEGGYSQRFCLDDLETAQYVTCFVVLALALLCALLLTRSILLWEFHSEYSRWCLMHSLVYTYDGNLLVSTVSGIYYSVSWESHSVFVDSFFVLVCFSLRVVLSVLSGVAHDLPWAVSVSVTSLPLSIGFLSDFLVFLFSNCDLFVFIYYFFME